MNGLACTTGMFGGSLETKLAAIAQAGFSHVELLSRDLFESLRGPDYTLSVIRDSGLQACCYQLVRDFEGCPRPQMPQRLAVVRQLLEQAQWVGADTLIVCANAASDSLGDFGLLCEDLHTLAELAGSHGVRLAYESLGWARWMSDFRDGWALVRAVDHPQLGLMLDSSHIGSSGAPASGILDIPAHKVFLAEVADLPHTRLDVVEQSRFYRLLPGEGMLALDDFVGHLRAIGFGGVYSLEVFNDHYRQLDAHMFARRAHQALTGLLA
jgi:4-hydroxyphenylpyruvate dioxygenase